LKNNAPAKFNEMILKLPIVQHILLTWSLPKFITTVSSQKFASSTLCTMRVDKPIAQIKLPTDNFLIAAKLTPRTSFK
jgi:hypothetical protein